MKKTSRPSRLHCPFSSFSVALFLLVVVVLVYNWPPGVQGNNNNKAALTRQECLAAGGTIIVGDIARPDYVCKASGQSPLGLITQQSQVGIPVVAANGDVCCGSSSSSSSSSLTFATSWLVETCGNLAPWAAVVVFLAPLPTIHKIVQDKTVGHLPLLPYSAMICSTILWSTYGILKGEARIWSANLFGLLLGLYYFVRFIKFSPKASATLPGTVSQHLQFLLAIALTTGLVATMSSTVDLATSIIGMGGVVFAFSMFASPLSVLKLVLEKKSAKSIPLPFTLASFVNCFLWSVFGLFKMHDVNIYLPNLLGLACTVAQIGLKLKFGDGHGPDGADLPE
ncbi:hypothetical protein ACA910_002950 [Epithemia clementina (nom. ined.)]